MLPLGRASSNRSTELGFIEELLGRLCISYTPNYRALNLERLLSPSLPNYQFCLLQMIESQALTVACRVIQHLEATSLTLMSNIQGLPASVYNQVQQIKGNIEDLNAAFSSAASFHDLSSNLLSQSREKVAAIRRCLDELLEYVVHNMPLTWLVGPFTPAGEHVEDD